MYTLKSPICIPMTNWRSANLRSALEIVFTIPHTLASAVPLGFCCGGFSSTAGYVSGNEAQCKNIERLRYFLAVPFQKVLLVFIRTTRKSFNFILLQIPDF